MMGELLYRYDCISDEIEKEKQSQIDRLFSSFSSVSADSSESKHSSYDENLAQHRITMLSLLCLRVRINGILIEKKDNTHAEQLENDLEAIIECVQNSTFEWRVTDKVLDDAWDILMAVYPEGRALLHPLFHTRYGKKRRSVHKIPAELFFLFVSVSDTYERLGQTETAIAVLEKLCQISKDRNSGARHRELICRVLEMIGDRAPQAVIRICRENAACFENRKGNDAGDFFWWYGCALQRLENNQEAASVFETCYEIRRALLGEDSWYTAIAKRECSMLSYVLSDGKNGRAELTAFLDSLESGLYEDVDEDTLRIVEGRTLYILLMKQPQITDLEKYDSYLCRYEEICAAYHGTGEPLLQVYLARNLRGVFCLNTGDYIQAEAAFADAIHLPRAENVPEIVTKAQMKSNLLMAYYVQNDMEMALPLLAELLQDLELDEKESGLTEKDRYRIYTLLVSIKTQSMEKPDRQELAEIKAFLGERCRDIQAASSLPAWKRELAAFVMNAALLMLEKQSADRDEQGLYLDTLGRICREYAELSTDRGQSALLNYVSAVLAWNLNDSRTESFFLNSLRLSLHAILPVQTKAAILQNAAAYFSAKGAYNAAMPYLTQALHFLENIWKSCVRYLNDNRLMQILLPTQIQFMGCYSVLRNFAASESAYETVLQFKALASLAGRERNRILHTAHMDTDLLRQIRAVQDKIAALETESTFRNAERECGEQQTELRRLEARLAGQFPDGFAFTDVSWEKVQTGIPDNSVVVEYFYCVLSCGMRGPERNPREPETGFDVYLTQKRNGSCRLVRLMIPDGEKILADADTFVKILQAESSGSASIAQINQMDDLRTALYQKLIKPVCPYLEGFEDICIAPDYDLVNLPFEILYDEEQEPLGDRYHLIKIECARDFLFPAQGGHASCGNLIIGNPQYELRERDLGERTPDDTELYRAFPMEPQRVSRLPFSQIEVQRIGKRCGSAYHTGYAASKELLLSAEGVRNIHIATHGYFDLSDDGGGGIGSSCLLFAGVCNWLKQGTISRIYGNGIVTADEVSRLDLRSAELVVLSSCLGGMNEVSINRGFYGMTGAFSAAGVHYVISNLWQADDFGTAVLMDAFYYQYAEKGQSPPLSLSFAKKYLRQVTIGELRRRGWFDLIRQNGPDSETDRVIARYEKLDDWVRPFQREAYWGGFVCCQCY